METVAVWILLVQWTSGALMSGGVYTHEDDCALVAGRMMQDKDVHRVQFRKDTLQTKVGPRSK